jgi:hypothetical protein
VTPKRVARIAAFVTLGVVGVVSFGRAAIAGFWDLLINAPFLTAVLGAPLAAAAGILTYRWRTATDAPETDVARSSDEWIAAVRSELAAVEGPRERRRFARAVVVVVVVRRTLTAWTWLLAGCVAAAVAVLSAVAMLPVAATEAAHLYSEAGVSLPGGEPLQVDSTPTAVLDTLHPVFIVLHLLFWLPGIVLGARLGARAQPLDDPPRTA